MSSSCSTGTTHRVNLVIDRSEETSELPTTKGGNQVPDTYNATSAPTRLIPAQPTSTTSLVTGFEQYTENIQSQPDSKDTKCDHLVLYRVHLAMSGIQFTKLVAIGTDCIVNSKSNY